ncbi:hypothetical protein D3OALGA1CA_4732 [Olavius algarvensis associated proteobacterium Delta 3]|nr:hypothetical protein D3OALGA1CA_4732 [Olavius algarvensis associated proteobacterium Delta 3]
MNKKVLVVDDDREMLEAIKEELSSYSDKFSVATADNGTKAIERLGAENFSLVVTDLKMPGLDGFGLLAHIVDKYPDIPVVIITGFGTPKMKQLAREGGAVSYITKPFLVDNLARKIIMTLGKESDGGSLHGVSAGVFLQLVELEERTCTVRLTTRKTKDQGVLWFREGKLLDARFGNQTGLDAAYVILSWTDVTLTIQNRCPKNADYIQQDLQAVLLEAMRLKDEDKPENGVNAESTGNTRGKTE